MFPCPTVKVVNTLPTPKGRISLDAQCYTFHPVSLTDKILIALDKYEQSFTINS